MSSLRVLRDSAVLLVALGVVVSAQVRPDRSKPPEPGAAPQLKLPAIAKRSLANGLAVWVVESREVPIVQLTAIVRAGGDDDPVGKFGTASLTAAMLDEGAGNRSALEVADAVEFLGATLTTSSSYDASAVRLNVPVQRLDEALPLLADVVLHPAFPEKEIERLRQERLTALLQARDDASSIAAMAFARIVFGANHRYGIEMIGTEASLKALTAADLRTFHGSFYQPSSMTLLVVGDTTVDEVVPRLEKLFGQWRPATPPGKDSIAPQAPQLRERQVYLVDKPDAEQSQIRIGAVGVPRSTPDYFPLLILNTVLGGSFTSRLNQNLREEHGYSYGARSGFDMRLSAGPFVAAAGVQTDKTSEALTEFFKELNGIREPIGADELTKAKSYIALGFPAEFEATTDLARQIEDLVVYRLPDDYFERYIANVMAVTASTVRSAAEKYIDPSRLAVVVVGDRKIIEPGIRALNLGTLRVMSVEEAIGK
jgi:predicted Zn-dependent peptidase